MFSGGWQINKEKMQGGDDVHHTLGNISVSSHAALAHKRTGEQPSEDDRPDFVSYTVLESLHKRHRATIKIN